MRKNTSSKMNWSSHQILLLARVKCERGPSASLGVISDGQGTDFAFDIQHAMMGSRVHGHKCKKSHAHFGLLSIVTATVNTYLAHTTTFRCDALSPALIFAPAFAGRYRDDTTFFCRDDNDDDFHTDKPYFFDDGRASPATEAAPRHVDWALADARPRCRLLRHGNIAGFAHRLGQPHKVSCRPRAQPAVSAFATQDRSAWPSFITSPLRHLIAFSGCQGGPKMMRFRHGAFACPAASANSRPSAARRSRLCGFLSPRLHARRRARGGRSPHASITTSFNIGYRRAAETPGEMMGESNSRFLGF